MSEISVEISENKWIKNNRDGCSVAIVESAQEPMATHE